MASQVFVIGDGAWGTALGMLLLENDHGVTVWGKFPDYVAEVRTRRENFKFLPGVALPPELGHTSGTDPALRHADFYVLAVPTQFVRGVLAELAGVLDSSRPFVSLAKGLEERTGRRPSEVVRESLSGARVAVISGPSHAEEVARRLPAAVVCASPDRALAEDVQRRLSSDRFRVYTSDDPAGVELGGALKNIYAIAAGIVDGLGLGDNAKAALLTRALPEMASLGIALGAREETFWGLSGIGDLMTTAYSPHGRNLYVGRQIGEGRSLQEILSKMEKVAEGVWTTRAALEASRAKGVSLPIAEALAGVLFEGRSPKEAIGRLMVRPLKAER